MNHASLLSLILLSATIYMPVAASARIVDDMPPPSRAPRTNVDSQKLNGTFEFPAELAGGAVALDGQTLRMKDLTFRLAGIAAPAITTPEGAAARAALDGILKDQTISCQRRDRDSDGRVVMNCTYAGGRDVAEELIGTGTVLFSRAPTMAPELAARYRTMEEAAQARRVGMWARVVNIGRPVQVPTAQAVPAPVVAQVAKVETPKVEAAPQAVAPTNNAASPYSVWFMALGLLGTLFGMLWWLDWRHHRRERFAHELQTRTTRQSLAAALMGELAAARDICEARAAQIAQGGEARWPRLRTYIYQSHAQHIGLLGPMLARQTASIYGQMTDYAAAARDESEFMGSAAMSRTLARLCGYIEITLEGLSDVEHTGEPYYPVGGLIGSEGEETEKHASQIAQKAQAPAQPASVPASKVKPIAPPKAEEPQGNDDDQTPPQATVEEGKPEAVKATTSSKAVKSRPLPRAVPVPQETVVEPEESKVEAKADVKGKNTPRKSDEQVAVKSDVAAAERKRAADMEEQAAVEAVIRAIAEASAEMETKPASQQTGKQAAEPVPAAPPVTATVTAKVEAPVKASTETPTVTETVVEQIAAVLGEIEEPTPMVPEKKAQKDLQKDVPLPKGRSPRMRRKPGEFMIAPKADPIIEDMLDELEDEMLGAATSAA